MRSPSEAPTSDADRQVAQLVRELLIKREGAAGSRSRWLAALVPSAGTDFKLKIDFASYRGAADTCAWFACAAWTARLLAPAEP
jgi:hypothetical protein